MRSHIISHLSGMSNYDIITLLSLPILATERGSGAVFSWIDFVLSVVASVIGNCISKFIEYISKRLGR